MLSRLVIFGLTAFLAGCQSAYLEDGRPNENSPWFEVPVGSKLVLKKELTIPAYQRDVFLQHGKTLDFAHVNRWMAYCAFSLDAQTKAPHTIEPDTFVVRRVSEQHLFQLTRASVQLAENMDRSDGSQPWRVKASVMALASERQPDIVKMTCASWGLPQDMPYITVAGIRESLGDAAELQLTESHAPRASLSPPGNAGRPGY